MAGSLVGGPMAAEERIARRWESVGFPAGARLAAATASSCAD
ncbi:hypothetical protein [Amycolatopsis sp. NPDC059021]